MTKNKPNKRPLPNKLTRRVPTKFIEDSERLLIVCEGQKTEPDYFLWLCRKWNLTTVTSVAANGSAPISIVDDALERKNQGDYDEVWCVFDTEKFSDTTSFYPAVDKAKANGLKLAISNPAFEYWFLLSFDDTTKQFEKCAKVISYLKSEGHIPNYDKGTFKPEQLPYKPTPDEVAERARFLHQQQLSAATQPHRKFDCNPSTTVYELVEKLYKMKRP